MSVVASFKIKPREIGEVIEALQNELEAIDGLSLSGERFYVVVDGVRVVDGSVELAVCDDDAGETMVLVKIPESHLTSSVEVHGYSEDLEYSLWRSKRKRR